MYLKVDSFKIKYSFTWKNPFFSEYISHVKQTKRKKEIISQNRKLTSNSMCAFYNLIFDLQNQCVNSADLTLFNICSLSIYIYLFISCSISFVQVAKPTYFESCHVDKVVGINLLQSQISAGLWLLTFLNSSSSFLIFWIISNC